MKFFKKLYVQVLVGLILGVLLGYFSPNLAVQLKPVADFFIKMIKMLISPIIFLSLTSGIAALKDTARAGRLAGVALGFFLVITTLALIVGLVVADFVQPGAGLHIDANNLNNSQAQAFIGASGHQSKNISELIVNIVPHTFFSAFVDGEILQVIFVSLLFGVGLIYTGSAVEPLVKGMQTLLKVFFKMINWVMQFAPLATFAAMAFSVGKFGVAPLVHLMGLVTCYYLTCIAFVFFVLGGLLNFYCKISMTSFLRYIKDELAIVWGTASSESVLPLLMEKLEHLGCEKSVVGLVLPLGYSFNLAGTAIYLTMAAMFIAQATNTELTLWQELSLLGVMIISSKGAAGVAGSGFIVLASSIAVIGHIPTAGVVLVLGIDKFMNEGRAIINMTGNAIAIIIISTWQKSFNHARAQAILHGEKEDLAYKLSNQS
jgi:aerobic C4-dicarboxylate transport protein